ncbi:hypothetical protein QP932_10650 [Corynebacterium freneyi]|uniref:hypothetical protein n=1 Tax=Corynebacterium freneyi TaxID=134034 RepID=UPI00254E6049|nr:hypothetical protein [Corynebacterium freneyi]MDK8768950.1 hypothetical protein [Corynebacterium freneyi]
MAHASEDTRRQNLDARITVRLGEAELADVKRWAASLGVSPSAIVRAATLDAMEVCGGTAAPAAIASAIDSGPQGRSSGADQSVTDLRREINAVGVNINQVVRKIHAGEVTVIDTDVAEMLVEIRDLLQEAREVQR